MAIELYVDEFLLAGNDMAAITWIKNDLAKRFDMEDLV